MNVKLLFPPRIPDDRNHHPLIPPLGIVRLSTYLRAHGTRVGCDDLDVRVNHDNCAANPGRKVDLGTFLDKTRVFDYLRGGYDDELEAAGERLLDKTDTRGFDLYGFSLLSDSDFSALGTSLVMAKMLKEEQGANIVFGGVDRFFPSILNSGAVDFIIRGKGEKPLQTLCESLDGGNMQPSRLDGLVYLDGDKVTVNDEWRWWSEIREVVSIPLDFDGLPIDLYRYQPAGTSGRKDSVLALPYYFSEGCVNRCPFCPHSSDIAFFVKEGREIAEDLAELSRRYDTRCFFFLATSMTPGPKPTEDILSALEKADLDILFSTCATVRFVNKEILKRLRGVGAVRLIFGLESAGENMLRQINKGITAEQAEAALRASNDAGIWTEVELIAGMPHETDRDLQATLDFIEHNRGVVDFYYLNAYQLKKGSLYLSKADDYGIANIQEATIDEFFTNSEMKFPREFDEVNGLPWQEKKKQIVDSYHRIRAAIHRTNMKGSDIHSIFYAYSHV